MPGMPGMGPMGIMPPGMLPPGMGGDFAFNGQVCFAQTLGL